MARNQAIRTLVVLDGDVVLDSVSPSLPKEAAIDVVSVVEGIDAAGRALESTACDALVVACAGPSERVLFFIENAVKQDTTRPVVVLVSGAPNGFVRRVFESGADDILVLPQPPELVGFAIQKALVRRRGTTRTLGDPGRLIVVLGPKGGTGKTLTSTNLAVALAQKGERVALVDLDLQFGDVGLCMSLPPDRTIYDLVVGRAVVDPDRVLSQLVEHPSGVRALLAPSRPDHAAAVSVEALRDIFTLLRQNFDAVVVDTPPGFTPEVIASIDMSTDLVMVGMLDSLSLKNTKLGLETLDLMGYDPERIRVVLNRAKTRVGITHRDVEAVLGREPDVFVPSDREIPRAVNEGTPIMMAQPNSEAAAAFRELAGHYLDGPDPADQSLSTAGTLGRRVFGRRI